MGFFSTAAELGGRFVRGAARNGMNAASEAKDKVKVVERAVETRPDNVYHAGLHARQTADASIAKAGREIADAAKGTIQAVTSKTNAVTRIAADKAKQAAGVLKTGIKGMGNKAVNAAVATCHMAGTVKRAVIDAAANGINTSINKGVGAAVSVLTANKSIESAAVRLLEAKETKTIDGCFLDQNCTPSRSLPARGKRPPCGGYDGIPKVMYTNGINTDSETCCDTMKSLANSRCVEVVGVYNATSGVMPDVAECVQNINRAGTTPAVKTQVAFLEDQLTDPSQSKISLFAHSQGGLITQESLVKLKKDLTAKYILGPPPESGESAAAHAEADMSRITVNSFGTAEEGWPSGPIYNRFTNTKDPVPIIIKSIQANHAELYPQKSVQGDVHRFSKAHFDPIASHSMDTVYLEEFNNILPYDRKGCQCGK